MKRKKNHNYFSADISMHMRICECVCVRIQVRVCPLVVCEAAALLQQNLAER